MALGQVDASRLQCIHLFRNVSDARLPTLLNSASLRHFPARTVLFTEGDRASSLYTLMQGSVELFNERQARRSTIAVIRSSKPFVLASIAFDVNPLSARTLERSQLLLVPRQVIHELLDTDPAFTRAMTYELAHDFCDIIEDFKNQRLRPAIERLAEWMVRCDQDAGGTGRFVIPCDKRTLASYLGMAPENLSRSLASLATVGVAVRGRNVSLNDRTALAALARIAAPSRRCESVRIANVSEVSREV
jgi:CRP/FNR family transcriptional regulator, transcriptional activator FtrB